MHEISRKRLLQVLKDAEQDHNYTLGWREWITRQLDRKRIGARLTGPDLAMRMYSILISAAHDYRYEKGMREWARRTARMWREKEGIRGW